MTEKSSLTPAERFKQLIEQYKQIVRADAKREEVYKWQNVKHFQEHFDLEADDFHASLKAAISKAYNLLYINSRGFIQKAANYYPEEVREMFRHLYDERELLGKRLNDFRDKAKELLPNVSEKHGKDLSDGQDERTQSYYLAMRFPDRYPLYKNDIYNFLLEEVAGEEPRSAGDKYEHYIGLAEDLAPLIEQDEELQNLVQQTLDEDCYQGDSKWLIFQDILFRTMHAKNDKWAKAKHYLKLYAKDIDRFYKENATFVEPRYKFFQQFFKRDFLEQAEWKDFQEAAENLHALSDMALAKKRAFGEPNAPIDQYRQAMIYLKYGQDDFSTRLDELTKQDGKYRITGLGESIWSELAGYAIPEEYMFLNKRDKTVVRFLDLPIEKKRGESFGTYFVRFNEEVQPLLEIYEKQVGRHTNTTLPLEVDQFFSWLYQFHVQTEVKYWIFQANPDQYRIVDALRDNAVQHWTVKAHKKEIKEGDKVILWVTGSESGCYALAEVTKEPMKTIGNKDELSYYTDGVDQQPRLMAEIEITHNLAENPILLEQVDGVKELSELKVGNQGTNFSATKEEYELLEELASKPNNGPSFPLNQIFYGPPGTGKTYALRTEYFPKFTQIENKKSLEEFETENIEGLTWWEVIALVLIKEGNSTVPQIREHRYIDIKLNASSNKSVNQVIWGMLQMHTSPEFENVKYSARSEPYIFKKLENSVWTILEEECRQKAPHLQELSNELETYKPVGETKRNYIFTTFHQSYSYEDFVEGIKPTMDDGGDTPDSDGAEIKYQIEKGIFYRAVDQACRLAGFLGLKDCLEHTAAERKEKFDKAKPYAVFIDEINRGNISAILGELITLIEPDKRLTKEQELIVRLPYSKNKFSVPPNLYIIGTLNTADRSVEALDTALRRRFYFKEFPPVPEVISTNGKLDDYEGIIKVDGFSFSLVDLLTTINKRIEKILDKDHMIGHSYFMNVNNGSDLQSVFKQNIIPLLEEYFFGDKGKIQLVLGKGFVERLESQQDNGLFPATDYDDQGFIEERVVWRIRDDWKEDESAFANAIKAMGILTVEEEVEV